MCGGNIQVVVEYVVPIDPGCNSLTGEQLIKQATDAFWNDPSLWCATFIIPACPNTAQHVDFYLNYCWKYVHTTGDPTNDYMSYAYVPCIDYTYLCKKSCNMCCDMLATPPTVQRSNCSSSSSGSGTQCDNPPAPGALWPLNHCYTVDPCQ